MIRSLTSARWIAAGLLTVAMTTTAAVLTARPTPAEDRQAIADVVALVAYEADARDWAALRRLYADTVRVDYTSLNGGEASNVPADGLIAGWRELLPGFDLTQHMLGPVVVALDGDEAVARTHVRALHRIAGAAGGDDWIVGGHYTYRLARRGERWAITGHTLGAAYQEGNRALPQAARQRQSSRGK
ncbi:MAG: nuclear transport factor 2 family protein [Gemmatimonadetes bacterium]|nr:nuclear transport factor 2 family protein [Gemmatimonadota bacterium]